MLAKLLSSLEDVFISFSFHDNRAWILESSGKFLVKSLLLALVHDHTPLSPFTF